MTTYTRRDKWKMGPEILGRFHALVMQGNLPEFEKFLAQYQPALTDEVKKELIEEFKRVSAEEIRRHWRSSK
jgi:hypothetical protein